MKRIQEAIERSDTENFLLFTRMMRIHFMLQNAVIIKNNRMGFMDILDNDLINFWKSLNQYDVKYISDWRICG